MALVFNRRAILVRKNSAPIPGLGFSFVLRLFKDAAFGCGMFRALRA